MRQPWPSSRSKSTPHALNGLGFRVQGLGFRVLGVGFRVQQVIHGVSFSLDSGVCPASHLHCTAGSSRSFTAIRKDAGLCCGSRLREGRSVCLCWAPSKLKGPKGPTRPEEFRCQQPHLTQCINQMVLESQIPHRTVNLLF